MSLQGVKVKNSDWIDAFYQLSGNTTAIVSDTTNILPDLEPEFYRGGGFTKKALSGSKAKEKNIYGGGS